MQVNAFLSCVSFKYQLCPKKSYDTNETNAYVQEYTLKERKKERKKEVYLKVVRLK